LKYFNINNYLSSFRDEHGDGLDGSNYPLVPRIECKDGFSISVQATKFAYCYPRQNIGDWDEVECGFPSRIPELIMEYAEDPERPTDTVYAYVPVELVEQLIDLHGGQK